MYLLDANVFIEAHQRYYGMDFVPGFWDWLWDAFTVGRLASVEKISGELSKGSVTDS